MIDIFIDNIGLAILAIMIFITYFKLRSYLHNENKNLAKNLKNTIEEKLQNANQLLIDNQQDNEKIQSLLLEIDELRKSKEKEVTLRLEAEKQIALALEKTETVRKEMKDWSLAQDAAIQNSKDSIMKVGNDLYNKLQKKLTAITNVKSNFKQKVKISDNNASKNVQQQFLSLIKANNKTANQDYFIADELSEKAKLFFCELAVLKDQNIYIFDLKAINYFQQYYDNSNQEKALKILQQKLKKYFSYLGNLKYKRSIVKIIKSHNSNFNDVNIFMILPSQKEINLLKKIKLYSKAQKITDNIIDVDQANNLVT